MIATALTFEDLVQQINSLKTTEDSTRVREAMVAFKEQAPADQYETVKRALSTKLNLLLNDLDNQLTEEAILMNGQRYDLGEWLTIANYAKKYGVSTHVVTNDIRRGKIPADSVIELTKINNTRMIKDQLYK